LPSKRTARIAALTVAAACSAVSAVVVTSPAQADTVRVHDIQGSTRISPLAGQKVTAAGGPAYEWRSIDPVNLADGGEPGGTIRRVFLFSPFSPGNARTRSHSGVGGGSAMATS
jgi:hypothetical protein